MHSPKTATTSLMIAALTLCGWRDLTAVPGSAATDWKQPTDPCDTYQVGDKVMHAGSQWISTAANNVWEPGVYGWVKC